MCVADSCQLVSVISLLSADSPDLNSPANVDAAKEVREDFPCTYSFVGFAFFSAEARQSPSAKLISVTTAYKKKVKRLARRSAEEAYD